MSLVQLLRGSQASNLSVYLLDGRSVLYITKVVPWDRESRREIRDNERRGYATLSQHYHTCINCHEQALSELHHTI